MSTRAVTPSAPAAELETPDNMEDSLETGFLSEDQHYRLTGELPEKKPSKKDEASAASAKKSETGSAAVTEEAPAASTDADTAAASAAADLAEEEASEEGKGPAQSKTAKTSESRWAKITRENKEMRERLARLEGRTPAETQRDAKQASQPAAEAKPATNPKPKIDDVDEKTGKPKYAQYSDFEDAKDEWLRKETLREFQETSAKTAKEQELARAQETLAKGFAKKLEPTRAKYADFDQVALSEDLRIPQGSVADGFLLDSPNAGELLYYLGQHPEILEGFYSAVDEKGKFTNLVTPFAQARELTKIELQLAAASEKKDDKTSSAKTVTQAPRPPHQSSGKGTVAKDAVEQAVEDDDSDTYMREANARDPRVRALAAKRK